MFVQSLSLIALAAALSSVPAQAALTQKELAAREEKLKRAFVLLKRVATQAKADRRTNALLDVIHIGRPAFDETLDRVIAQTERPPSEAMIEYRKSDEETECLKASDWSGQRLGYVWMVERKVVLCKIAFRSLTLLSNTIIHEFVHVQGIVNECDAEGIGYLTFTLAHEQYPLGPYAERCKSLRDLREELKP